MGTDTSIKLDDIQTKFGINPLDFCISMANRKGVQTAIKAGFDTSKSLPLAALIGDAHIVSDLIKAGADTKATDKVMGNNALHMACMRGSIPIVKALLLAGLNPNESNMLGYLPVHLATLFGYTDIAKLLLTAGGADYALISSTMSAELNEKLKLLKEGKEFPLSPEAGALLQYINNNRLFIAKQFSVEATETILQFFANSPLELHLLPWEIRYMIENARRGYMPYFATVNRRAAHNSESWYDELSLTDSLDFKLLNIAIFGGDKIVLSAPNESNSSELALIHLFNHNGVPVKASPAAKKILQQKDHKHRLEQKLIKVAQDRKLQLRTRKERTIKRLKTMEFRRSKMRM